MTIQEILQSVNDNQGTDHLTTEQQLLFCQTIFPTDMAEVSVEEDLDHATDYFLDNPEEYLA